MGVVTADFVMTMDGCIGGRDIGLDNPGGTGAEPIMSWIHSLASWRKQQGMEGGIENRDSEIFGEWFRNTSVSILGRRMFDLGEPFWGDNLPFRTPVFVVTHRPRPDIVTSDTTVRFVTEGIHEALKQARAAAGDGAIDVGGGAECFQQFLAADLIDELQLHIVPHVMGDGLRLFGHLPELGTGWEVVAWEQGEGALHVRYRRLR